jgi:hypothetical protein
MRILIDAPMNCIILYGAVSLLSETSRCTATHFQAHRVEEISLP